MSMELKLSQFIYGKYVGPSCGDGIIAWTDDLKDYKHNLQSLVETSYRFWGEQAPRGDYKAVGICLNTTGILSEKEILLIQVAPAIDKQGNSLGSGGRAFVQHRYIFLERSLISQFNNHNGLLLQKLYREDIPYFTEFPSENENWATLKSSIFHLDNNLSYSEQEQVFLQEASAIKKALSVILQNKNILITRDEATIHPLKFLDNLLCWLPITYRKKLNIAVGAVDENYCKWANIIVKTNGFPSNLSSSELTWFDRHNNQLYPSPNSNVDHEYVTHFIDDPIQNKWADVSAILEYLNTTEYQDFDPKQPPLDSIWQYPSNYQHKKLLSSKYPPKRDEVQERIDNLSELVLDQNVPLLWHIQQQHFSEDIPLVIPFFIKTINYPPEQFGGSARKRQLYVKYIPNLLKNGFLKSIEDLQIIGYIEQVCQERIAQEEDFDTRYNLLSLCVNHGNIFTSKQKIFDLSNSILTQDTLEENFKKLFTTQIIHCLPDISVETLRNSSLYSYLNHSPEAQHNLYYLLFSRENGGLNYLPLFADALKINNDEVKRLYLVFILAWQPKYEQGLPIIISSIEKSVEENLQFKLYRFIEIYEHFKIEGDFRDLGFKSQSWSSWENLASSLHKNHKNWKKEKDIVVCLDRILGTYFCSEMLRVWSDLFIDSLEDKSYQQSFLNGNTWKSLGVENIRELHKTLISPDHREFTSKLVRWAISAKRQDLIDKALLNCLKEIWESQGFIDPSLWDLLTDNTTLECFDGQYWIELFFIKLYTKSNLFLPPPQKPLSDLENEIMSFKLMQMPGNTVDEKQVIIELLLERIQHIIAPLPPQSQELLTKIMRYIIKIVKIS